MMSTYLHPIRMKSYLTGVILLFLCNFLCSQTYNVNLKSHKINITGSLAFWSGVQTYDILRPAERIDEYKDIDPKKLWRIDRNIIGNNSSLANRYSNLTLFSSIAAPILLTTFDRKMSAEGWSILWMGLQGFFIENSVNQTVKIVAERPRPYIYSQGEKILNTHIDKNSTKSFFSGHASTSAFFSFFTAKVFSDLHPESRLKPLVWSLAVGVSGTTAFLRTNAGKHFYTDVIIGWVFGASVGILIPELYKKRNARVSLNTGLGGVALQYHF